MYTEDFELDEIKDGTKIGFTRPGFGYVGGGGGARGEYGWGVVNGTFPDGEFITHTGEMVHPDYICAIDNTKNYLDGIEKEDDWILNLS